MNRGSTGKSFFAIYVLLRRLQAGQPTLFSTTAHRTYLFDQSGIRRIHSQSVDAADVLQLTRRPSDEALSVWSLIDPTARMEPVDACLATCMFFYVVFTPPERTRFKHLITHYEAETWIMSTWTDGELFRLCV